MALLPLAEHPCTMGMVNGSLRYRMVPPVPHQGRSDHTATPAAATRSGARMHATPVHGPIAEGPTFVTTSRPFWPGAGPCRWPTDASTDAIFDRILEPERLTCTPAF